MHIMCVDDHEANLLVMRHFIETTKCDDPIIKSFTNSVEALDYYLENKGTIDIIFLDWLMPGVNGEDFARSVDCGAHIAVVTATDSKDINTMIRRNANISGIIRKPFTPECFALELRRVEKCRTCNRACAFREV